MRHGQSAQGVDFGHGSLTNSNSMPNPLLGSDASSLAQSYYAESLTAHVPPDILCGDQSSIEDHLIHDVLFSGSALTNTSGPYEQTSVQDEMSMDESDDEPLNAQSLAVRGYRDIIKPYSRRGTEVRTFSAFAQDYALSEYMDYAHSSELRRHDMQTIFMHYVSVSGPTMSLYERDPASLASGARFDGDATIDKNLWSRKYHHSVLRIDTSSKHI